MALMKTGRRGVEPTKKGEDPKKSKAQQEVKVTAQKQYSWDDVSKNLESQERNKAKKVQYESDVASYNQAMKLYNEGVDYSKLEKPKDGIALPSSKVRNKQATFNSYEGVSSAKSTNTDLEKRIKSGEYVSLNDPSINPTTRKLILGTRLGTNAQSDILGKKTGEMYIPKGTKFKDYKEIYGEDFNPEEWHKAATSGKFDEYSKKNNLRSKSFWAETGLIEKYQAPSKPNEPYYEKEEVIPGNRLPVSKMRTLKKGETFENIGTAKNVGKVVKPVGKLSISKKVEEEKPTWEDPSRRYMKTKFGKKIAYNVSVGEAIGSEIGRATNSNKLGSFRASKSKGKIKESGLEYNKQRRQFKAYYGAPSSISGSDLSNMTAGEIAKERESLKGVKSSLKADIRKTTPQSTVTKPELKAELRNIRKDIRATNKAFMFLLLYLSFCFIIIIGGVLLYPHHNILHIPIYKELSDLDEVARN
jgi:hypothetical protein